MKADLRGANLNHADLTKTNLLGAKMDQCKCDSLCVGERVLQEQLGSAAEQQQDKEAMADYYQQAEEVYRGLRKTAESEGLFTTAGVFLRKELHHATLSNAQILLSARNIQAGWFGMRLRRTADPRGIHLSVNHFELRYYLLVYRDSFQRKYCFSQC